jgi:hypothetical protein
MATETAAAKKKRLAAEKAAAQASKTAKFLNAEDAEAAALKLEGDEDWSEGMEHEESTSHHKAINRSC